MTLPTIVLIGCSTDPDYNFLLPLTMLLWRDLVGHEPRAYLVGSESEWAAHPRLSVCLGALRHHDLAHRFIARLPGYQDATLAQNVRQHAAADPSIPEDAWVMPADADLWPLRRDFYHQHESFNGLAACYYANGDHFISKQDVLDRAGRLLNSQTIPTCHVAMRAREWREVYDLLPGHIEASIRRSLDPWLAPRIAARPGEESFIVWMSDQQMMTEKLCAQDWFPGAALMIDRYGHPPVDRLCRSVSDYWARPFDPTRWLDAHMHKDPTGIEHWAFTLTMIAATCPKHEPWARNYREEYARWISNA